MAQHLRSNPDDRRDHNRDNHGRGSLNAATAARRAKSQLLELTGKSPETVSSVHHSRSGWAVRLEVVELERIPQSTDILASYHVELDERGDLVGYERVSRYYRNQASPEE